MFSTVNHFQTLEPGGINDTRVALQIQTREPMKSIRKASNFTKQPWLEKTKEDNVHTKNTQSNKMSIIQHIA